MHFNYFFRGWKGKVFKYKSSYDPMKVRYIMTTIKGEIPHELEKEFRRIIALKYGFKKGNLSLALQNAIEEWIIKQKRISTTDYKETELLLKQIRKEFPYQFTAVGSEGKIIAYAPSLIELYQKLDLSAKVLIIEPEISILNKTYKKRQLSWNLKRKRMVSSK